MKKFLAMLLAMLLVLVNVAALAEVETEGGGEGEAPAMNKQTPAAKPADLHITKNYTVTGDGAVNAPDTLEFRVTESKVNKATTGTEVPALTIETVDVETGDTTADLVVVFPTYLAVGEYIYKIEETDTGVAGVGYLTEPLFIKVQVLQGTDGLITSVTVRKGDEDAQKIEDFENTYDAGTLTVSKTVSGNLGDVNKDWHFTVVFNAPEGDKVTGEIATSQTGGATAPAPIAGNWTEPQTVNFTLKNGQSVKFANVPKGVTYTVKEAEDEFGQDGYTSTVSGAITANGGEGKIDTNEADTVAFLNTKAEDIDTGIFMDSLPYMMIMMIAMAGAMMLIRRREQE